MSQTLNRRRRLQVVRNLPAKHCPFCQVRLERTVHPGLHVKRCAQRLKMVPGAPK